MACILTKLPPDLLGDILCYYAVSQCVIKLYLTGNRDLKSKLMRGVRTVELKRREEMFHSKLPKFLTELRSLRILRIERTGEYLCEPEEAAQVVKLLSPTLVELHLNFERAADIFVNPDYPSLPRDLFELDISDSDPSGQLPHVLSIWNIGKVFPRLELLHLGGKNSFAPEDLQFLPPTLTHLKMPLPRDVQDYSAFMKALPSHVTQLSPIVALTKQSLLEAIPSHLTYLDVGYFMDYTSPMSLDHIKMLPSTLLTISGVHEVPFEVETASALSRQMVEFNAAAWKGNIRKNVEAPETIEILDALPPQLRQLRISSSPLFDHQCIRRLPRHLKVLSCNLNWENLREEDWPETLTYLKLKKETTPLYPLHSVAVPIPTHLSGLPHHFGMLLPPKIETLVLEGIDLFVDELALLPATITSLNCMLACHPSPAHVDVAKVSFPPHLHTAELNAKDWNLPLPLLTSGDHSSVSDRSYTLVDLVQKLPISTRHLRLSGSAIGRRDIAVLPPLLDQLVCTLKCSSSFDNTEFLERMRYLVQLGVQYGCGTEADILAASQRTTALPFDLIPRTLRNWTLALAIPGTPNDLGWSRLPPLFQLSVDTTSVVADDFFANGAPHLKNIETLRLDAVGMRDEHMALLPRTLRYFYMPALYRSSFLTPACVHFIPPGIDAYLLSRVTFKTQYSKLNNRRKSAFSQRNWPLFHQLCIAPPFTNSSDPPISDQYLSLE